MSEPRGERSPYLSKYLWIAPVVSGLTLAALFVAGCASLKSKIVGSWKIDPASVKSPFLEKAAQNPELAAQIKKGLDGGRFDFKADGTVSIVSQVGGTAEPGTWSLNGNEMDLTVKNARPGGKPKVTVNADGTRIHIIQNSGELGVEMDLVKAQ